MTLRLSQPMKFGRITRAFISQVIVSSRSGSLSCQILLCAVVWDIMAQNGKVLTIQSHVVSGYVGNKSATFPLQVLGFDVDPINSVQFSNHTGYGVFKGQVLNDNDLDDLMEGLRVNHLDNYSHLLTGYVGSPKFLTSIAEVVKNLRAVNPNLIYVCDPVMGDNGKMYVPLELLPIYRDVIVPLADIVTPNQYEVELLTGTKIQSISDAWAAVKWFHKAGVKTVVLSSTELGDENHLLGLASTVHDSGNVKMKINIPKFPASFTGTGDLFAALFLAWMSLGGGDLKISLEKTIGTMQAVLKRTLKFSQGVDNEKVNAVAARELKLIQSKKDIEEPKIVVNAEVIENC